MGSGPSPPTARALPSKSAMRPGPYRSMEGEATRAQVAVLGQDAVRQSSLLHGCSKDAATLAGGREHMYVYIPKNI